MHAKRETPYINIEGDEDRHLYAIWSKSGKRLIVTVYRNINQPQQVELTEQQVLELGNFFLESREEVLG